MDRETIAFGVIGCGLMGREFASAAGRWCHIDVPGVKPEIVAACDVNPEATDWFEDRVPTVEQTTDDYQELLANPEVDAVYCALPHNLHEEVYLDILEAGKHLLGEKPFGIDRAANRTINEAIADHPELLVRSSSELPFFPGAFQIAEWVREERFGEIFDVEAGFWHSSDLNPDKKINWKRRIEINGEYGCMGDLGLHVVHMPFRFGWVPDTVYAQLENIMTERWDGKGNRVPCETWDNAILSTRVETETQSFPMTLSTKRIAPGHANTWFIRIFGTKFSAEFSTKNPKEIRKLPYEAGGEQAWHSVDAPYESAYPAITGGIFEFGLSDAILQMWGAFCDEIAHGEEMHQPFRCATPEEAAWSHELFTAALESHAKGDEVSVREPDV